MEKLKDKIEKYINKTGVIRTPAYFIKDLFNEVLNFINSKLNSINKSLNSITNKNKQLEESVIELEKLVQDYEIKNQAIEITYIKNNNYDYIVLVNEYNSYNGLIIIDDELYSDRLYYWKEGESTKIVKYITDNIENNFLWSYNTIQKIEINRPINIDISNFEKAPIHINSPNVKVLNSSNSTEFICNNLYLNYYVEFPPNTNITFNQRNTIARKELYLGDNFIYDENHITDFSKFKDIGNLHLYNVNALPSKDSPYAITANTVIIHESCKLNLFNLFSDSINIICKSNDVYCEKVYDNGGVDIYAAVICNIFEIELENINLNYLFFKCNKLILHKYNSLNLRASFKNVEISTNIQVLNYNMTLNNDNIVLTTDDIFSDDSEQNHTITIVQKGILGAFACIGTDVILDNVSIFNYILARNIHIYGKLRKIIKTIVSTGDVYVYDMDEEEFLNIPIENPINSGVYTNDGTISNLYIKNKKIDTIFIDNSIKIRNLVRANTVILDLTNFNYFPNINTIITGHYYVTTIKYINWPISKLSFSPNVVQYTEINTIIIASMTAPSIASTNYDYLKNNGKLIVPTGATGFESSSWQNLFVTKHNWTIEYSDELAAELNGETTT